MLLASVCCATLVLLDHQQRNAVFLDAEDFKTELLQRFAQLIGSRCALFIPQFCQVSYDLLNISLHNQKQPESTLCSPRTTPH